MSTQTPFGTEPNPIGKFFDDLSRGLDWGRNDLPFGWSYATPSTETHAIATITMASISTAGYYLGMEGRTDASYPTEGVANNTL